MIKIDKIFGDKKSNAVIYILLAMGVLLLVSGSVMKPVRDEASPPYKNSREAQTEKILSQISGVGEVSVMISGEKEEKDSLFSSREKESSLSVLIVAEGGADSRVREKIIRAASAALGAEPHKIEVFERKVRQ